MATAVENATEPIISEPTTIVPAQSEKAVEVSPETISKEDDLVPEAPSPEVSEPVKVESAEPTPTPVPEVETKELESLVPEPQKFPEPHNEVAEGPKDTPKQEKETAVVETPSESENVGEPPAPIDTPKSDEKVNEKPIEESPVTTSEPESKPTHVESSIVAPEPEKQDAAPSPEPAGASSVVDSVLAVATEIVQEAVASSEEDVTAIVPEVESKSVGTSEPTTTTEVVHSTGTDAGGKEVHITTKTTTLTEKLTGFAESVDSTLAIVGKEVAVGAGHIVESVKAHPELIAEGALAVVVGAASLVQPELIAGEVAIIGKMATDAAKKSAIKIVGDEAGKIVKAVAHDVKVDKALVGGAAVTPAAVVGIKGERAVANAPAPNGDHTFSLEVAQQTPQIDLNGDGINDIPEVPPVTLKITIGADGVLKAVTQSTTVDHPIVATPALVEKAEQLIVEAPKVEEAKPLPSPEKSKSEVPVSVGSESVEASKHTPEPMVEKSIKSEEPKAEESGSKSLEVAEAAPATVIASEVIGSEEPKEKIDSIPNTSEVVEPTPAPIIEKEEPQPQIKSKEIDTPVSEVPVSSEDVSPIPVQSPEEVKEDIKTPQIETSAASEEPNEAKAPKPIAEDAKVPEVESPQQIESKAPASHDEEAKAEEPAKQESNKDISDVAELAVIAAVPVVLDHEITKEKPESTNVPSPEAEKPKKSDETILESSEIVKDEESKPEEAIPEIAPLSAKVPSTESDKGKAPEELEPEVIPNEESKPEEIASEILAGNTEGVKPEPIPELEATRDETEPEAAPIVEESTDSEAKKIAHPVSEENKPESINEIKKEAAIAVVDEGSHPVIQEPILEGVTSEEPSKVEESPAPNVEEITSPASEEVKGEIDRSQKEDQASEETFIPQIEEPTTEIGEEPKIPAGESKVEESPLPVEEKSIEPDVLGELKSEEIPETKSHTLVEETQPLESTPVAPEVKEEEVSAPIIEETAPIVEESKAKESEPVQSKSTPMVVDNVKEEPKETPFEKSEEIVAPIEALKAFGASEPINEEKTIPIEAPKVSEPSMVIPVETLEVSEPISEEVSAPFEESKADEPVAEISEPIKEEVSVPVIEEATLEEPKTEISEPAKEKTSASLTETATSEEPIKEKEVPTPAVKEEPKLDEPVPEVPIVHEETPAPVVKEEAKLDEPTSEVSEPIKEEARTPVVEEAKPEELIPETIPSTEPKFLAEESKLEIQEESSSVPIVEEVEPSINVPQVKEQSIESEIPSKIKSEEAAATIGTSIDPKTKEEAIPSKIPAPESIAKAPSHNEPVLTKSAIADQDENEPIVSSASLDEPKSEQIVPELVSKSSKPIAESEPAQEVSELVIPESSEPADQKEIQKPNETKKISPVPSAVEAEVQEHLEPESAKIESPEPIVESSKPSVERSTAQVETLPLKEDKALLEPSESIPIKKDEVLSSEAIPVVQDITPEVSEPIPAQEVSEPIVPIVEEESPQSSSSKEVVLPETSEKISHPIQKEEVGTSSILEQPEAHSIPVVNEEGKSLPSTSALEQPNGEEPKAIESTSVVSKETNLVEPTHDLPVQETTKAIKEPKLVEISTTPSQTEVVAPISAPLEEQNVSEPSALTTESSFVSVQETPNHIDTALVTPAQATSEHQAPTSDAAESFKTPEPPVTPVAPVTSESPVIDEPAKTSEPVPTPTDEAPVIETKATDPASKRRSVLSRIFWPFGSSKSKD